MWTLNKRSFLKALAAIVPGVALLSRGKPARMPLVETGPLEPVSMPGHELRTEPLFGINAPGWPAVSAEMWRPARDHRVNGFAGTRYDAPVFLSDEHGSWGDSDRDFAKIMREDRPMPSTEAGRLSFAADMHRHQLLADARARKVIEDARDDAAAHIESLYYDMPEETRRQIMRQLNRHPKKMAYMRIIRRNGRWELIDETAPLPGPENAPERDV